MKTKQVKQLQCSVCGSSEALYITLANGDRLPSFRIRMADRTIVCNSCDTSIT